MIARAQRIRGALLGAVVADAAARPLHWIYKEETLAALLTEREHPEFWPTNQSPFYSLPTGSVSAYADTSLLMLRTLAETDGEWDPAWFLAKAEAQFGAGSSYAEGLALRESNFAEDGKTWKGAIAGPWLHQSQRKMLEQAAAGMEVPGLASADEADGWMAAMPWVALNAEAPHLLTQTESILRMVTNSDLCVNHGLTFARLLRAALQGNPDPVAQVLEELRAEATLPEIQEELQQVLDARAMPHTEFVASVGKACPYPGTFQGALHAFVTSTHYEGAIRATIRAGGCNCSRGNQVGALWGAVQGEGGISQAWIRSTFCAGEVRELLDRLLGAV